MRLRLLPALGLFVFLALASAQNFAPPEPVTPTAEQLDAIKTRADRLERALSALKRQGVRDPQLADVEIYHKAADWIVRHGEFYRKDYPEQTVAVLERGLLRASQLATGDSPWLNITGSTVVRAYRSAVDGSVQPYAVTFPANYGRDPNKRYRLDVVLHGRNSSLTEVSFLHANSGDRPAPKDLSHVRIDIYGRGNNAYRWAGESDVQEAIDNFLAVERLLRRDFLVDTDRVVLRGFSMGGAGTWHLGLHRPDRWVVLGPGAGFTTTRGYIKNLPEQLPDYVEKCLHIYDAVDYAENVFNVPVVAYSGDKDPQMQAATNIEERLKGTKFSITHLVAPGLEHQFPPEWQAKAEVEYAKHADRGRPEEVKRVRFVTWTLKYPRCEWVQIVGLERHYEKTLVDASMTEDGYKIETANVRLLRLALPLADSRSKLTVVIDKDTLEVQPSRNAAGEGQVILEKRDGVWKSPLPQRVLVDQLRRPQKRPDLQGPIDDAFTTGFLCVRGTGTPWNQAAHDHAEGSLKRFVEEWDKYFRGRLEVKDDADVTAEDIASRHLILFGDPGSNRLIAQCLDGLPLRWTKGEVELAGAKGAADSHLPALIYPSPLNTTRYVVLNSGHTFHAADFKGTNALLYPRLGDYALLKLAPTDKEPLAVEVVKAGLFDEFWNVTK